MKLCIATTSWDDGHQMDKKLSSLLLDYGMKGTFYVAKNRMSSNGNNDLIRELDEGFEIGAHTLSHCSLTDVYPENVAKEVKGSKEWLEEILEHSIEMFSYPNGKYNGKVVELVKQAGFLGARTLNLETTFPKDPFMLGIGCQASNGSPLLRLKSSLKSNFSFRSLVDWRTCAKSLFDHVSENGGVWHLWGHSWEVEKNGDWEKLQDILAYVSHRKDVAYLTNGQIIKRMHSAV